MAKLSPCIVPSVNYISAPPMILEEVRLVLIRIWVKNELATWILRRATFQLKLLKVLPVSTSMTPSVDGSSKVVHIAWIATSAPVFKLVAVEVVGQTLICRLSVSSLLLTNNLFQNLTYAYTSYPGFLFRGFRLRLVSELNDKSEC